MATGSSKSFSTKSLDHDEEYSEFCENFAFSDTVRLNLFLVKFADRIAF
jgi:hypothetical protein